MVQDSITCTMYQALQARAWCVTLWSLEEVERLRATPGIKALCVGREVCPTTSKVHFQSYVRFASPKRFEWWKKRFPEAHVEIRKYSEAQASSYCRKDGDVVHDFGCEVGSEKSGDAVEDVLDLLEAGAPHWQIYREHRKFFFHNSAKIRVMTALMSEWTGEQRDFKRIKASLPEDSTNG